MAPEEPPGPAPRHNRVEMAAAGRQVIVESTDDPLTTVTRTALRLWGHTDVDIDRGLGTLGFHTERDPEEL